jgi:hypothetical protein
MKNKRNLLLLPLLLLPVVGLTVAFATYEKAAESKAGNLWSILTSIIPGGPALYCLAAMIMVFIFIVTYPKRSHTDEERAATLLIVKGTHLIAGAVVWLSVHAVADIRGIEVSNYLKTWFQFSLLLGGSFGYFLLLYVAKNTRVRTGWVFLVCVLQFVFVLDVVSALLLWLRIKKIGRDAGVENETAAPGEEDPSDPSAPAETDTEIAPAFSPKKKGFHRFRWLLLLPGIYLPYSLVGTFLVLSKLPSVPDNPSPLYDMILVAPFIAAVLCNLIYVITGLNQPNAAEKMTRANMIVLLIQIPGYIINFFLATVLMLTIFTVVVGLLLSFFNIVCLLVTSILGAGMVMGTVKEGKMPVRTAFFTSIFNYVYFADAVYAIVLFIYLVVKRVGKKFIMRRERQL